jgi:hypothetical protein
MGLTFTVDCCEATKALAVEILNLCRGKITHMISFRDKLL